MRKSDIQDIAALLKSISHPMRLSILCVLREGEMTAGQLQERLGVGQSNLSQHLGRLRSQGVVACRRSGTFIYNRLADERIVELIHVLHRLYCTEPDHEVPVSGPSTDRHAAR